MNKPIIVWLLGCFSFLGYSQADILNTKSSLDIKTVTKLPEDSEVKPLEYAHVSDDEILFSITTWEVIDLSQRVNFPYLYPIDINVVTSDRKPLIDHIIAGIDSGEIIPYYSDNFTDPIDLSDFENEIKVSKLLKEGQDNDGLIEGKEHFDVAGSWYQHLLNKGYEFPDEEWVEYDPKSEVFQNMTDYTKRAEFKQKWDAAAFSVMDENDFYLEELVPEDITKYVIKGIWYFDKVATELKYRPIAMGPVGKSSDEKLQDSVSGVNDDSGSSDDSVGDFGGFGDEDEIADEADGADEQTADETDDFFGGDEDSDVASTDGGRDPYRPLFWFFYPESRGILSQAFAFNPKNLSKPFSFDHLINSRRFSGTIYKEGNIYQDRYIRDYIPDNALLQLLESDRIKEKIRNKEQDMWNY